MILPGQTIGILGGGQLGRMFAIAARRMGYRVHAFDPTNDCPTGQIADVEVNARYTDIPSAVSFAKAVDVVTFEFENIPAETLAAISQIRPVHPSPFVLDTTRHRLREKNFLSSNNFPVAPYREVKNIDDLHQAVNELGTPSILKTAEFGYDGKGQSRIDSMDQIDSAWTKLNCPLGVLEGFVRFTKEISVIVVRKATGESCCFDVFENHHTNHILDTTICPATISAELEHLAKKLATNIANQLNVVGLLTVEMFVVDNQVVVNELAPRPHNSGHLTLDACISSQFEQQLRAVCDLPLGDTTLLRPAAMVNLLGDLWKNGEPKWDHALKDPRVKLHLYGKDSPKPNRKMGHLTAIANTAKEAQQLALQARAAL